MDERYERLDLLGRGGMGTVHRARDRELDREVAIKVLHMTVDSTVAERFRREAAVLASLSHPHIIEVYDHGVTEDGPFIVMELLEGRDLDVPPPGFEPLEELLPIADALATMHARGLVHRDVKPANILRTRSGRCVLMDFGLIYVEDRTALTQTGAVSGTLTYMSPEVMQLAGPPTPSADWWALGVTLYTLYEKKLPYTMDDVLGFATSGEIPPLRFEQLAPDTPPRRAIEALLAPDPARRPTSRAHLEAAAAGHTPPPRVIPRPEPNRLSRAHLVFAAVAVVLGVLGGYISQTAEPPPPPPFSSGSNPPPIPTPTPTSTPRFGEDFLAQARRDLRAAEHLAVSEDWRVVPRTGPDAWLRLTDLDPLAWGALWGELDHLVRFHAWLADGGRPEDLDAASRDILRQVDELHSGQLLPAPFAPLLEGPATDLVPVPPNIRAVTDDPKPLGAAYSGWLGAALRAANALYAFETRLQADVDASVEGRPTSEHFPRSQGLPTTVWRSKVSSVVETHFLKPEDRLALRRWFAPGMPLLRRLLYCTGRALRPGEPNRVTAMLITDRLVTRSLLFHSEFAHMAPELALGLRPDTFAARLAHAGVRASQVEVLHRSGLIVDPPVSELLTELDELQEGAPPAGAPEHHLEGLLVRLRLRLVVRAGSHEAILELLEYGRRHLDDLGLPRLRVRVASTGFELWDEVGPDAPGSSESCGSTPRRSTTWASTGASPRSACRSWAKVTERRPQPRPRAPGSRPADPSPPPAGPRRGARGDG